ncbi:peptidylprolyl isomerase [Streptococcus fryi]
MKKRLLIGLTSLLLLSACQKPENSTTQTESNTTTVSNQQEQEKLIAERIARLNQADFPQLTTEVADNEAVVKIKTTKGDITLKLFPEQAPLAVENFMTHAKEGYYDGIIFHRVLNDFMIQTGDPEGNGTGGQSIWQGKDETIDKGHGFANEISDYLYNIRGSLSMANAGPDTNGSQFFINQNKTNQAPRLNPQFVPAKIIEAYKSGGNPHLDGLHTVFGQVIEGIEIVDEIAAVETNEQDKPIEDVTIKNIEIVKDIPFK